MFSCAHIHSPKKTIKLAILWYYHKPMAKLSIGIVGLPNVGKSTLFNALTKKSVPAENYPFCTIDPSVGIVPVPDERLYKLSDFSQTEKTVPAVIEFVDIAGLVKGASEGEGLGNQFLSHIRETDAIAEVVRIFEDGNVIHVHGKIDPLNDIGVINLELILADTGTVTKRLGSLEKDVKKGDKLAIREKEALTKILAGLEGEKLAREVELIPEEHEAIKGLSLITMKPIMYILNKKAGSTNLDDTNDERYQKLMAFFKEKNAMWTIVDAGVEHELKDLAGEEKEMFRTELGAKDDGINALIKKGYELLNLETYFTTGKAETRAWTIQKGSTAPVAGMAIHTDFKEKFIRAEIVFWKDLLDAGSFGIAREKGLIRTEGKEYIVKDGDVIEFKI
jgi:ribosome-binding ATPase